MPIVEREPRPEKPLDYVFGKVSFARRGRGSEIVFGWNTEGFPFATSDQRRITAHGQEMSRGIDAVQMPFDASVASYTPVAYEFAEIAKPLDKPDQGRQFTEDTLNLAVTDESGGVKFIAVSELSFLNSILKGQVEWTIGGYKQYTLVVPDAASQKVNIILFSPGQSPSNEFAYRTFLLKTIKTLSEVDRNQNPPDQKGYVAVVNGVIADLVRKGYGDRRETEMDKIMIKLGVLGETKVSGGDRITYLNVDQYRFVIEEFQKIVSDRFQRGKI
jgi:hypothetical protein